MNSPVKNFFNKTTALVALASIMSSTAAQALDVADATHGANVTINKTGDVTNIGQTTANETINWTRFNIGQQETVNFNSANASDITVNKVNAANGRSMIQGMLNSNHRVAILNDAGMTITSTGQVNVGSLIASTAKGFSESGGKYNFSNVNSANGTIVNQGQINVSDGGYAVLVAPEVRNEGTIKAKLGRVDLAAANGFTIDVNGNGNINYLAGADLEKAIISNTGTINALGGIVNLRSDKAKTLADSVINLNGVINVDGMDANVIGTTANGSAILANSYGDINATTELKAGHIDLQSTKGNINTAALTSINNRTLNTAESIVLKATDGKVTVNGPITAINAKKKDETLGWTVDNLKELGTDAGKAKADVVITAKKGVSLKGTTDVFAVNHAGADALLKITSNLGNANKLAAKGDGDIVTDGAISVYAAGTREMNTNKSGFVEDGGDINATANIDLTGNIIKHNADVRVKAYAFHDIRTFIEYLSRNSNENTALGYYKKDAQGNPVAGEILFSDLASINTGPTAWADLSFVDFSDIGFFILPDASSIAGQNLSNRQPVTFAKVGNEWVVKDAGGNTLNSIDAAGAQKAYALFSDKTLNSDGLKHLVNSDGGEGNMNWGKIADQFCEFNDFNFQATETGADRTVKTYAKYQANASKYLYTPPTGANIYVDSKADAKNSEAEAHFIASADTWMALGDPHVTAMAYKNALSNIELTAKGLDTRTANSTTEAYKNLWINAPLVAQSYAASREVGSANSNIKINVQNGNFDSGVLPGIYTVSDALGGKKANANTVITAGNYIVSASKIGAVANTFTGLDAKATTSLSGKNGVNLTNLVNGAVVSDAGYAFSIANGDTVSGISNQTDGDAKIVVVKNGTVSTNTTYAAGSGDNYKPYQNTVKCTDADPCTANPNTNTVGGWSTTTTVTGGTANPNDPNRTYGSGVTAGAIAFDPYKKVAVNVTTPTPGPGPSPVPTPVPDLNNLDPLFVAPSMAQKEPASGGGLFCRDVNLAGMPGLCGPAPVREVALAPAGIVEAEPASNMAPKYASPFRTGAAKGKKKAQVANLEPGSGNKCLVVHGKKVCIEEQIDK